MGARREQRQSPFKLWLAGLIASAGLLAGCSLIFGIKTLPTYRYRVLVEVNTPEGVRRGSSVIAVKTQASTGGFGGYSTGWSVNGDAVTIDLGRRGKLFMTLKLGLADYSWAQETMKAVIGGGVGGVPPEDEAAAEVQKIRALTGWQCIKGCGGEEKFASYFGCACPLFVTFRDPNDPATIRVLHSDRFDSVFGNQVSLRDVKVAITEEAVTRTIVSSLPWLANDEAIRRIPAPPPGAWGSGLPHMHKIDFTREE